MDGGIDYSAFSRAQLEDALTRIDKDRYPRNYESLVRELQVRPMVSPVASAPRDLRKWVIVLGWYQLLATGALLVKIVGTGSELSVFQQLAQFQYRVVLIAVTFGFAILAITTAVAGVLTVRGNRFGLYFGIASFAAQAVTLTVPGFSYRYIPGLALQAYWSSESFGFTALLGPDSHITYGGSDPVYISVDVLAVFALVLLLKFMRRDSEVSISNGRFGAG
jgi:hypothetical protein